MILKLKSFLFLPCLINSLLAIDFIKYKQNFNITFQAARIPDLKISEPFRVRHIAHCGARCNREAACHTATFNATNYCQLFGDKVTVMDLKEEMGTVMLSKRRMNECDDPDYYADMQEMVCKLRVGGWMTCQRHGHCMSGLYCNVDICQCRNPRTK